MLVELLQGLDDRISAVTAVDTPVGDCAEGQLDTDAGDVRIRITLAPGFPFRLPHVEILEEGLTSCPPLLRNRVLCWQDDNDALVDHTNPARVVEHCLDRTRALLDHALHERPWPDIMAEYGVYWSQRSDTQVLVEAPLVSSPTALAWTGDVLRVLRPAPDGMDAVLVPLRQGHLPLPPAGGMTVDQVRKRLLSLASAETRKALSKLISPHGRRFRHVIFQLPRENSLPLLLGVQFVERRVKGHPLLKGSGRRRVRILNANNWDFDFFRERGGADLKLKPTKVLVIGCGSVGGAIVQDLARSGVGHLTLVDPDIHTPENAFRHVLGIGKPYLGKAGQLAMSLMTWLPGVQAVPVATSIEGALAQGTLDLSDFDAAVVAVDRPSGAQAINLAAYQGRAPATVVHAWLEAYGLASHVLRTHPPKAGCFECLVRDPDTGKLDDNRAHLAAGGQDFLKDQAGCGGRYVPFGAVHASRTAVMAVEEVLHGLRGDRAPRLLTWRGDASPFLDAGFRLSRRAEKWPEDRVVEILDADAIQQPSCPVCQT